MTTFYLPPCSERLRQPATIICAPGTHYGYVNQGSLEYEVCPTLLHMASTENRTPDLLILSPMPYPFGCMLPSMWPAAYISVYNWYSILIAVKARSYSNVILWPFSWGNPMKKLKVQIFNFGPDVINLFVLQQFQWYKIQLLIKSSTYLPSLWIIFNNA